MCRRYLKIPYSNEIAESAKGEPKTGDVNIDELVGNADGLADSGYM